MPKVGGKKFAYTPEGEAAAAEYAQQTGAPFQMRAKAFNNSPMQKNFGDSLAINRKLDKNSGNNPGQPGPILKKTGVTSKLDKSSMQGGMTGRVSLGDLDGPLKKNVSSPLKKGGASPTKSKGGAKPAPKLTKFNTGVQKTAKTIGGNIKTGIDKFAKSVRLKKTGNIGAKLKQKYSTKAQRAGTVAKPGESQHQFKTRTRKSTPKTSPTSSTSALTFKRTPLTLSGETPKKFGSGLLTSKLKTSGLFKPLKTSKIGSKIGSFKPSKLNLKSSLFSPSTTKKTPTKKTSTAKSWTTNMPKVGTAARTKHYVKHGKKLDPTTPSLGIPYTTAHSKPESTGFNTKTGKFNFSWMKK